MSDACCCFVCVRTQEVGVVEDLGQFKSLLEPGLHCINWPLQNIVGRMSLRIQQLDVQCETKTKDNVGWISCHQKIVNVNMNVNPNSNRVFTTHESFSRPNLKYLNPSNKTSDLFPFYLIFLKPNK